jgi:hypothetical protein
MALPLLTYGCPVWGPQSLFPTSSIYAASSLDRLYTDFLKRSLGLGPTAPHAALKLELQYTRPSSRMLQQILRFRESILTRPDNDLVKTALTENIEMANKRISNCWSFQLQRILSRDTSTLPSSLSFPLAYIDPDLALREREEKLDAALYRDAANLGLLHPNMPIRNLPDHARDGLKVLKYLRWCKPLTPAPDPKTQSRASFSHNLNSKTHIHTVARLRMCNLPLRSETGRLSNLPRSQRTCTLCNTNSVEDEYHLLTCPTFKHIRDRPRYSELCLYWNLPDPATTTQDAIINHIFNPPPHLWRTFAALLNQCLNLRQDLLSIPASPHPT